MYTHTLPTIYSRTQPERCHFSPADVGATCSSYVDITSGREYALKVATATVGPICVSIDASQLSFQVGGDSFQAKEVRQEARPDVI